MTEVPIELLYDDEMRELLQTVRQLSWMSVLMQAASKQPGVLDCVHASFLLRAFAEFTGDARATWAGYTGNSSL